MARIENHTEYPSDHVRSIVRWCVRELELQSVKGLLIRVKHLAKDYTRFKHLKRPVAITGRAYASVSKLTRTDRKTWAHDVIEPTIPDGITSYALCRLWKPAQASYPVEIGHERRGDPPLRVCQNWQEVLVVIVAHELNHHVQFRRDKQRGRRRGGHSEIDCAWAEHRLLLAFREWLHKDDIIVLPEDMPEAMGYRVR